MFNYYVVAITLLWLTNLLPSHIQVCQTMGYALSKGVIHRDLIPAYIMVGAYIMRLFQINNFFGGFLGNLTVGSL